MGGEVPDIAAERPNTPGVPASERLAARSAPYGLIPGGVTGTILTKVRVMAVAS